MSSALADWKVEVVTDSALADYKVEIVGADLTDEQLEVVADAVGALIVDNSVLDFTYDDASGTIVGTIKAGAVTDAMLATPPTTLATVYAFGG